MTFTVGRITDLNATFPRKTPGQPASSCTSGGAGSVSDPATLESIRSALNYLVYGAGRKRCPQNVYADAHYGLAMVEKAQREAPNMTHETEADPGRR
ncbi:MAG: hypothetical protein WC455_20345 [Dehalococcoidia bacterium]|jgi:hypothetical protein